MSCVMLFLKRFCVRELVNHFSLLVSERLSIRIAHQLRLRARSPIISHRDHVRDYMPPLCGSSIVYELMTYKRIVFLNAVGTSRWSDGNTDASTKRRGFESKTFRLFLHFIIYQVSRRTSYHLIHQSVNTMRKSMFDRTTVCIGKGIFCNLSWTSTYISKLKLAKQVLELQRDKRTAIYFYKYRRPAAACDFVRGKQ